MYLHVILYGMPRIRAIPPSEATGELREVYESITSSRGKIAAVHTIQSLNPASIRDHMALYATVMFGRSPLSRAEREMIAVTVSAANRCGYCIAHHCEALDHFWRDRDRVDALATKGPEHAGLSDREDALCEYARTVTTEPASGAVADLTTRLKSLGVEDRGILDASLVVAYFNFVNRIVLSLGVELEPDPGGYRYE